MKKIAIGLVAVALSVFVAGAAETLITGVGSNYTGVGTFQVTSDGSKATLTVDNITVLENSIVTVGNVLTNAAVANQAAAVTATGTVTIAKQTYVVPAILADGTTNSIAVVTNATATVVVNVLNGAVVVTNVVLTTQGL